MITAEDLALAQALLAAGKIDAAGLESALASLGGENSGKRLREVLVARGLLQSDGAARYGATLIPGSIAPPVPAAGGGFDRTMMASGSGEPPPPPSQPPPPSGRPVRRIGRFEIVDEIARGGMGIVYRAWEPSLNRHVALKILIAGQSASEDQVQRFLREARAAAGLQHPNIVQVFEVGEDAGSHWFAMELIDGSSLDRVMKQQGAFPPRTALRIARDIARALHFAHQKGIVHRDVKPGNILVASTGKATTASVSGDARPMRVLLGDFGLARDASAGGGLTLSGNLLGTPAYMSPEQASGRTKEVDAQSDVFGLGSVLYELLSGKAPFQAASLGDVLSAIISGDPPPLRQARPGLHRDIELIVAKAMAREKARRYATAGDFADDLDRYLNGEAIQAEAPSFVDRLKRWARSHAPLAVACSVAIVAAGAGGGFLWRRTLRQGSEAREREESRRRELGEKVAAALREAHSLAAAGEFGEADVRVAAARALNPLDPSIESTAREVRMSFLKKRVGEVAGKVAPTDEEIATARSLLKLNADLSADAEVRRLARLVEGTCSWSLDTAEDGLEVDVGTAEPGIFWDEETFPPIEAARAAGLCAKVGAAPVAARDIAFGEYHIIISRGGAPVRVIPAHFERNTATMYEHRVLRVGRSNEATHARIEDALGVLRAGNTILLEGDVFGPVEIHGKPGVLVAAVPGAQPTVSNAASAGLRAGGSPGVRFRDITVAGGTGSLCEFTSSPRASLIRCVSRGAGNGIGISDSPEWHVRECTILAGLACPAVNIAGRPGGLLLRCRVEGGSWGSMMFLTDRIRCVQSVISRGKLAAAYLTGPDCEFSECEIRDCPNWGIIGELRLDRLLVRDCRFVNCGSEPSSSAYPGALVVRSQTSTVVHNTFVGSAAFALTFVGGGTVRDNLFATVVDFKPKTGGLMPGAPISLRGDADGPTLAGNLFAPSTFAGRVRETMCTTEADFAREALGMNCPPGTGPPLRRLDPVSAASIGPDGRLAPGSPLLTAAADGGPAGARFDISIGDSLSSVDWVRRDIARIWARRGEEALDRGDRSAATGFLARAMLVAPADPAVTALRDRLE